MTILQVTAKSLKSLALALPPESTLVIEGEAGIGKTEIVKHIATLIKDDFYKSPENCQAMVTAWNQLSDETDKLTEWDFSKGIPCISRRLSQMFEGDLLGIATPSPFKGSRFTLVDWIHFSCRFPCLLFLDERRRAIEAVKQGVFELQDSHGFHGMKLYPTTRVFIADNIGGDYSVNTLDAAEMSRACFVRFTPTIRDWIDWALGAGIPRSVVDFHIEHENSPNILEFSEGARQPEDKTPDRRAWTKAARTLERHGYLKDNTNQENLDMIYLILASHIGTEVAAAFVKWFKTQTKVISVEEMFKTGWETYCKKLDDNGMFELVSKIESYFTTEKHALTDNQMEQLYELFKSDYVTGEKVLFITKIFMSDPTDQKKLKWLQLPGVTDKIVKSYTSGAFPNISQ
jgi:energy-coupling factor transporter ATP-binding protein EcfA2